MLTYCKKNPMLVLAIVSAIISVVMFFIGRAYESGCKDTTIKQVSQATAELYVDVKDIKKDVGELKTDVAVMKSGIKDIKDWIKPTKEAFNAVQNK